MDIMDAETDSSADSESEMAIIDEGNRYALALESNEGVDAEEPPLPTDSTFDSTLPATHSYLGHNLEELRGRTVLDDGIYMNLPLFVEKSVVLFPGQTLPMTVLDRQTVDMLQTCIRNDRTFGVVSLINDKMMSIGTTAEIYEYSDGETRQGFRLKAKGRQRFKILRVIKQGYDKISANVKVLPEITLGPPLQEERLASLNHLRVPPNGEENPRRQERVENIDAMITPWPAWVYGQYDPVRLSSRIRKHLRFIENRGSSIPEDPTDLSFWVGQNLLLDDNERIVLLNYNCAISRLQRVIKYLTEDRIFVCGNCRAVIGKQSNMFPMSREGPQNAYCNSAGIIHETITLYHAQGLSLSSSPPSTDFSWFPGYAWTVATCKRCGTHMGWRFTAVQDDLVPKVFWGLASKNLRHERK